IEKLREANIGKIQSPEHIEKRVISMRDYNHSPETRSKMSATRKEQIASGQYVMTTNRAAGKDAGHYRDDVDDSLLVDLYNAGNSLRKIGEIVSMEHHSVKERLIRAGIKLESNA